MEWRKVSDELPAYGEPVLLSIKGIVQHITYQLDGADEVPDWFEPYNFDHADDLKLWYNNVDRWIYIDDIEPPKD